MWDTNLKQITRENMYMQAAAWRGNVSNTNRLFPNTQNMYKFTVGGRKPAKEYIQTEMALSVNIAYMCNYLCSPIILWLVIIQLIRYQSN